MTKVLINNCCSWALIILLFAHYTSSNAQVRTSKKSPHLKIVNSVLESKNESYPILYVTLQNSSRNTIIINKVKLQLISFVSNDTKEVPHTKVLKPDASWDIELPTKRGEYTFQTRFPLQIGASDASTIQIRFHGYPLGNRFSLPEDVGIFQFKLFFISTGDEATSSDTILLKSN